MLEHIAYVKSLKKFKVCAIEGAILVEGKGYKLLDELWVVTLDKDTAFKRVKERNPELSEADIRNRIDRQTTDKMRLPHASWHYSSAGEWAQNRELIRSQIEKYL